MTPYKHLRSSFALIEESDIPLTTAIDEIHNDKKKIERLTRLIGATRFAKGAKLERVECNECRSIGRQM